MEPQALIIDNKDYYTDNYRISAGRFVADLAVVSCLAISSTDPNSQEAFYIGVPSVGFKIKWDVSPENTVFPLIYKARSYSCAPVPLNTFVSAVSTSKYSVAAYTVTTGNVYDPAIITDPTIRVVGGMKSTNNSLISGVSECLLVPTAGELVNIDGTWTHTASSKGFKVFTLSGGIESVRVTVSRPPSALVTVALSCPFYDVLSAFYVVDYYELSGKILSENNVADQWYVDVSGWMYPDQYPSEFWALGWSLSSENPTEQLSAFYINKASGEVGDTYVQLPTTVPEASYPYAVDRLRFYFSEPGEKYLTFSVWNTAINSEELNTGNSFATYTLKTRYLNSVSALRVNYISSAQVGSFDAVTVSAVSFFNAGTQETNLDSSFPNIRWSWPSPEVAPINLKTGAPINKNQAYPAQTTDFLQFFSTEQGIYPITAYTDSVTAIYTWYDFTPKDISLVYKYDNCPESRKVEISAVTTFEGGKVLFYGNDKFSQPLQLKWMWDSDNVAAFSNDAGIFNGSISQASYSNPITAIFNNPESLSRVLCSTTFSVSTDVITTNLPPPCASFTVNYDLWPKGFDVDFDLNYEKASLLDGTFYRIVSGGVYTLYLRGKIKPDDFTGWLESSDIDLLPEASTKVYYYFNGDRSDSLVYGANQVKTFDMNAESYRISSVTFEVSCLSASENFGYGHTKNITVNLNLYRDDIVPELSVVVFPEYYWRLPSTSPSVCSLYLNPELYWSCNAAPSAYGEGRSNLFLASAFDSGFEYSDFIWHVGTSSPQTADPLLWLEPSESGVEKSTGLVVAGFLPSLGLYNTTLSTYKNDFDGSTEVFKNWKTVSTPISTVNYDEASSIGITYTRNIVDANNVYFYFDVDVKFPEYSPVALSRPLCKVRWNILSDTGENFSGETLAGEPYSVLLDGENNNSRVLYVQASAFLAEYIPNVDGYVFDYPAKYFAVQVPAPLPSVSAFDVSLVNFTLSSLQIGAVADNNTYQLSAWSESTLSGVVQTVLTAGEYDYKWTVGTSALSLNQPFITSLAFQTNDPRELETEILPVTLTLYHEGQEYTRTKELVVNPKILSLDWRVFSDNLVVKLGDETFFYNDTRGPIPLSSFRYRIDGESEETQLPSGEVFYRTMNDGVGSKNLLLTAFDTMNYVYSHKINNIVSVVSAWEEYKEDRGGDPSSQIKFGIEDINIKPNEWVISETINKSFEKIYSNLVYLEDIGKFYANPPYKLLGWYGVYGGEVKWSLYPSDGNYLYVEGPISDSDELVNYMALNKNYTLLAYKRHLEIRENNYTGSLIDEKNQRSINDNFREIKNVVCDDSGNIVVLDSHNFGTVTVYEYDSTFRDSFKYISKWGGLGSAGSNGKFRNPNDISIDSENNLWVSDTGNRVIKKYTITGGWLETLKSELFGSSAEGSEETVGTPENGSVISAAAGKNGLVYALTNRHVVIFEDGLEIEHFEWVGVERGLSSPVRICASSDDNILYVVCKEGVLKFTKDGRYVGAFGLTPQEYDSNQQSVSYVNLSHLDSKVLYLVSTGFVLKYADFVDFLSIKPDLSEYWWQPEALGIGSEEFVDYWVYNRVLSRLWDNHEYFRTSLQGRVLFSVDINGKIGYKLYERDEIYRPLFTYSKSDVLIGVNELVTTDVVNRCLGRIHQCSLELLNMIINQNVRYRWVDTLEIGSNPLTWGETKKTEAKPVRWGEAIS